MGTDPPVEAIVLAQARVSAICRVGVAKHSSKEAASHDEGGHEDLERHANEFVMATADAGLRWSAQKQEKNHTSF